MLLLNKKLNALAIAMVALSPMIVFSIDSRADEAKPTEPTAPAAEKWTGTAPKQVIDTELQKYIKNFKVKKVTDESGTRLAVFGLGLSSCLRHLHIDLDRPTDDNIGVYALRVSKRDFTSNSGKMLKIEEDCDAAKTSSCSRDPDSGCVLINEGPSADALGVRGIESTPFTVDGKITFRTTDIQDSDPSAAVQFKELSKAMGGPLDFKSPETIAAEMAKKHEQERNELLLSTCKGAEQGNRDDLEQLKEMIGPEGMADKAKFIEKLEKKVNQNEFSEIEKKLEAAETIEALNSLIDEAAEFAHNHPEMKGEAVRLLVDGISKKALELESEKDSSTGFDTAKLKLSERALKVAFGLDRKNGAVRKAYALAKLERFKFLANTGNDRFYNETTRREAANAFRDVSNWAKRSRDPEVAGVLKEYVKTLNDNKMIPMAAQTPYGPQVMGYVPGNSLDETYVKRSLEEEFKAYRANAMGDGVSGSGYNFGGGYSGGGNAGGRF